MHHKSWSNLRKSLEEDRLCPALRGRVQYFLTRYHDAHDDEGRLCIRVDEKEYLSSHQWNHHEWYHDGKYRRRTREEQNQKGLFCYCQVLQAIDAYMDELTIDEALSSEDPLIRLFAVLDRRVGKRRLSSLASAMENEPEWLQFFYRLRLEAEGYKLPIRIVPLTCDNFRADSLDGFIRHQEVTECWRCVNGEWQLLPIAFTEDWDLSRLQAEAADVLRAIAAGIPAIGAFDGEKLVGFAQLGEHLGSRGQYIELVNYHVSAPYRGQGIGRRLFAAICDAARSLSAEKLYISAHSSKESQTAYQALGCVLAQEVDAKRAANEPCDVQMEYDL